MNHKVKKEYPLVDLFRIVAACLIVGIHVAPFATINESLDYYITYCIGRVGVPFFMILTGYFSLSCMHEKERIAMNMKRVRKTLFKFLKIYILVTLLYLPVIFYSLQIPNSVFEVLKQFVFDGTFYHLWYFPAVVLGIVIITVLYRFCSRKAAMVVGVILYFIGLFGDSFYGVSESIPMLKSFYGFLFSFSSYTRNGIFYAPVFLLLGMELAKRKRMLKTNYALLGFFISIGFLLAEGAVTKQFSLQRHNSMYASLLFVMYFLMVLLLKRKVKREENKNLFQKIRIMTMWVYILHPMVIIVIRGVAGVVHMKDALTKHNLIQYILVCACSFFASWVLMQAQVLWKQKRKVHNGVHENQYQ